MTGCEHDPPCPYPPVEVLVYLNPNIGPYRVCAVHLRLFVLQHP